jgi:Holliday junction resolvase RusA-like endonuclease
VLPGRRYLDPESLGVLQRARRTFLLALQRAAESDGVFKVATPPRQVQRFCDLIAKLFLDAERSYRHVVVHTPTRTRNYETEVTLRAKAAVHADGLRKIEGPVVAIVTIYRRIPKGFSKKNRELAMADQIRPITRPDGDNVSKSPTDAINEIVYHDDAQIVDWRTIKRYDDGHGERVEVTIEPWTPTPQLEKS